MVRRVLETMVEGGNFGGKSGIYNVVCMKSYHEQ